MNKIRKDTATTLVLVVLCLFGAAGCIRALAFVADHPAGTDFDVYATGGRAVSTAPHRLYDLQEQLDAQTQLLGAKPSPALNVYEAPPLVAVVVSPIARLPLVTGVEVFLILLTLAIALSAGMVRSLLPETLNKTHRWFIPLALVLGPGVVASLLLLQLEPFLVIFALSAIFLVTRGRLFLAGLALAGLGAKPQYLWILPLILLMARQWRLLGGLIAGAGIWLATTVLIVGFSGISAFLGLLGKSSALLSLAGLADAIGWPRGIGLAGAGIVLAAGLALSWRCRAQLAKDPVICCIFGVVLSTAVAAYISVPAPLLASLYLVWRARTTNEVPLLGLVLLYAFTSVFLYDDSLVGRIAFDLYLVALALFIPISLRAKTRLITRDFLVAG